MTHAELRRLVNLARPGAEFTLVGDKYSGLTWLDQSQTKPTAAELGVADE